MAHKKSRLIFWLTLSLGGLAVAQSPAIGSVPPKLQGQTLEDKSIALPEAAAGKVTLLLISTSRKAGERCGPWRERFASDFGSDPVVTYYVAALLESAPSFIRGMIRSGIRKGTPPAAQPHTLTSSSDEAAWKAYLNNKDDSVPAILLLDATGHLRWSYNGVFGTEAYEKLKQAMARLTSPPAEPHQK